MITILICIVNILGVRRFRLKTVPPVRIEVPSPGWRFQVLAALLLIGVLPIVRAATPGEVSVGQTLRSAQLQGLNGPSRNLSEYRGKPLVINVWASWCGPCRMEMGSLERLSWRDEARQFVVIGISTDDYAQAARAFLSQTNATFNHYLDHALAMENMLGANRLPLTVLVDADGRVLKKVYGAREWDSPQSLQLLQNTFKATKETKARGQP
jgi:thiol-disulfide isomerase/thioredoxin